MNSIIKKYNYIPNENARNVFRKSSNTIAVFIQNISNPFYTHLIMELNNRCLKERYSLLICDTENDIEKENAYIEFCLAKRCTGIIITEGFTNDSFEKVDIPVVSLDRNNTINASYVTSDNYTSARDAVRYMYNLGHRKIAFVGAENGLQSIDTRYKGYIDELTARGIEPDKDYVYLRGDQLSTQLGRLALNKFMALEDRPTAVFCANDMIALGVLNEARVLDIDVPARLSVCGFDHVVDDISYVPLTTVEQDIPKIAQSMIDIILKHPGEEKHIVVSSKLIKGGTCSKLYIK